MKAELLRLLGRGVGRGRVHVIAHTRCRRAGVGEE